MGQRAQIVDLCREAGFASVTGHDDLAGIDRVVVASR